MSADRFWYKDAIIYQLHIRAFADSDADGVGDFRGLTSRLDYLQDLGVTAVWLLPFYPSPLKDDGYDIADYTDVNPLYGTLADFRTFLREAHERGLRVITELVINHTSDQHGWFQRARRAKPNSAWRNFYVWSDTPDKYTDARIIFKDFEPSNWTWDAVAGAYYWHRFYSHQPDLNFDSPAVRRALIEVMDFWLEMGVDGMRLDAVPYLYEREGTNCENLPETHAFLRELRRHVDQTFGDRMLLAEANQWPEDAVAYFGNNDECHMAFHFPVMPRLFMAVHMEDRFPVVDIMQQTPALPESGQWALFLRNHDELTLEMVTDEDRDYMYRAYAADPRMRINLGIRRRLAPLLGNDRRRLELLNGLLFALPGTPIMYYGDEIGMGDNIYLGDRNGVRTPMQWSSDRNAGFSRANPQRLYAPVIIDPEYHYEAINVEAQQNNPHSLLWWTKRIVALRKRLRPLGRGSLEFLHPENGKVLAFLRRHAEETLLVVANLSRFVQYVQLDLSPFKELVPVEVFSRSPFPPIGELPYLLTLGPHSFYWFSLTARRAAVSERALPALTVRDSWTNLLADEAVAGVLDILSPYITDRRWFGGRSRALTGIEIADRIPLVYADGTAQIVLLQCSYADGPPETYVLPVALATGERRHAIAEGFPGSVIARVTVTHEDGAQPDEGLLYDAFVDDRVAAALLALAGGRQKLRGPRGAVKVDRTRAFGPLRGATDVPLAVSVVRAEQSNTSVVFGDRLILKLFRRLDYGVNPELELGRYLTERTGFRHAPRVAASLEYNGSPGQHATLAVLQEFVPNHGDAWAHTLETLSQYFDELLASTERGAPPEPAARHPLGLLGAKPPAPLDVLLGGHMDGSRMLGERTAALHMALAAATDADLAPEPFGLLYQRALYQGARTQTRQTLEALRRRQRDIPETDRAAARELLRREGDLLASQKRIVGHKLGGKRIRVHGDFHLGQVLFTGNDYVIIDFEGEPARALGERRFKRSPLRDVAGMLRSYRYAAAFALRRGRVRPEDVLALGPWADQWTLWTSAAFLDAYMEAVRPAGLLPKADGDVRQLLDFLLLDKAVYELGYELNHRPDWVRIPLDGLLELLQAATAQE